MNLKRKFLQVLSILFIFGGIIRLFANRYIFKLFYMESLWIDHSYFIYIYRVLGSFVILTGIILFTISKDLRKYVDLFCPFIIGFVVMGLVMLVTGILIDLPLIFYFPDFFFCFIIGWFIYSIRSIGLIPEKRSTQCFI